MATLNTGINGYIRKLRPTPGQIGEARARRDTAIKKLQRTDFRLSKLRKSGSIAKHTALRPVNDADVVAFMHQGMDLDKADEEFDELTEWMEERYGVRGATVRQQPHSIGILYESGPSVDIVPGVSLDQNGVTGEIRNRDTNEWIITSPAKQVNRVKYLAQREPRFYNYVRLAKQWGKLCDNGYSSYAMELLAERAFLGESGFEMPIGWAYVLEGFFEGVIEWVDSGEILEDWGNPENDVTEHWYKSQLKYISNMAEEDLEWLEEAINKDSKSYNREACRVMKKIFGDEFPPW